MWLLAGGRLTRGTAPAGMHTLAWQLVNLGQELGDDGVSGLAGRVLSLCGTLQPSDVAFTPATAQQLRPLAGSRRQQRGADAQEMYVEPVLTALAEALATSPPIDVLGQLHYTLLTLLAAFDADSASEALHRHVAPVHADALIIFCGSKLEVSPPLHPCAPLPMHARLLFMILNDAATPVCSELGERQLQPALAPAAGERRAVEPGR